MSANVFLACFLSLGFLAADTGRLRGVREAATGGTAGTVAADGEAAAGRGSVGERRRVRDTETETEMGVVLLTVPGRIPCLHTGGLDSDRARDRPVDAPDRRADRQTDVHMYG